MISKEMRESGKGFAQWLSEDPVKVAQVVPLSSHFNIKPIDLEVADGRARLEYEIPELYANFRGIVHGGIVSTLLDDGAGIAASFLVGRGLRGTASASVSYLSPVKVGKVEVDARVLKYTRSMIFVDATIMEDGELCARSSSILTYGDLRPLKQTN